MRFQKGVTLIEMIVALGIMATIASVVAVLSDQSADDTQSSVTADYTRKVGDAGNLYTKDNYAALTGVATATTPALIRVSDLVAGGYLTSGFSATNPRRQATCILVLEPSPNNLVSLLVTEGGDTIDDLTLGHIASLVGGAGGGIYSTNTTNVRGAMGGYNLPVGNFANANHLGQKCDGTGGTISFAAGHPMMALWYADGASVSPTLYRDAVPGNPTLNTMNTPILMGASSVKTVGDACTDIGAIARSASGQVVSCVANQWQAAGGSAYWGDPVATYAALPACNAANINQTRVVATPTTGSGRRAFTCNGAGSWDPLGVDNSGNITIAGVATVNKLAGNLEITSVATEGAACSPNGRIARDANGLILSCQSGVWTTQGSGGATAGMYSYFNSLACPSGWVVADGTNGTVDLRGEFIRGLDGGRGVDAGRVLASSQTDLFKAHNHYAGHGIKGDIARQFGTTGNLASVTERTSFSGGQPYTSTTGGAETRPRNVALLPCMKS